MRMLPVLLVGSALMVLTAAADAESGDVRPELRLDKRSTSCSLWSRLRGGIGFRYIPTPMTWAAAERNCQALGGNLASVHNYKDYQQIQKVVYDSTHAYGLTWIGGSDAQQEGIWLWSDGKRFNFSHWCHNEPNNMRGQQHCLQINHSGKKCWDDQQCNWKYPSVCAKKCSLLG